MQTLLGIYFRELLLKHNYLRLLPNELGKLFNLQVLNLDENPMAPEVNALYTDSRSVQKLLTFMLDNLPSECSYYIMNFEKAI